MFPINQRVCFHFFVNTCNVPSSSKLQVHKEEEEESGGGEGADGRSTLINQDSAACTSNGGTLSETQHPSHPADAIPPLLIDLSQLCHLFRGNFFSFHLNQLRGRARGIMEFCSFAGLASVGLVNCICV